MRGKLLCLITGAPRSNDVCYQTLQFLLRDYDVTYVAVVRSEFNTEQLAEDLTRSLGSVKLLIIDAAEVESACCAFRGVLAPNVVRMWFELYKALGGLDLSAFDYVLRTRYDIIYSPARLVVPTLDDETVLVPSIMSWSGVNDMIAVGRPQAMIKYLELYKRLPTLTQRGICVPEIIASVGLACAGLEIVPLDIRFALYRHELMSEFTPAELQLIAHKHYIESTFKIGTDHDTPESRKAWIEKMKRAVSLESLFPLYEKHYEGDFYLPEKDARDGVIFRFMGRHGALWRSLDRLSQVSFKVCYKVPQWDIQKVSVVIDGRPFNLCVADIDEFGRPTVVGRLEREYAPKCSLSKIGFACHEVVVPSKLDPNSNDHRTLSMAITEPVFT